MCLLFESIQINEGRVLRLEYHQQRVDRARFDLLGLKDPLSLQEIINDIDLPATGRWKLRIPYEKEAGKTECILYQPKSVSRLCCAETGNFNYQHKFSDRSFFERLICKHPGFDELILTREGEVTDTTYTNLAFFDGGDWFTPDRPLLKGTRRQHLLETGFLKVRRIMKNDIPAFSHVSLINAMLDIGEISLPIHCISQ